MRIRKGTIAVIVCAFAIGACFAQIDRSRIQDEHGVLDASSVDASSPDGSTMSCEGASLCDGFERSDLLGPWGEKILQAPTTLSLTSTQIQTGAKSLEVQLPADSSATAFLRSRPQQTAGRTTLHYSVFVGADFAVRSANLGALTFKYDGGRIVTVYIGVNGGRSDATFILKESGAAAEDSYDGLSTVPLIKGRWVDIAMELDHTTTPTTATLSYDGVMVAEAKPLPKATPRAAPILDFGVVYAATGPATSIYFDDVRLEVIP